ncbi:SDR family NAD(P)-dependent oxidoreductase [Pseudohoeflea coraliihabitans]|uniref:SDR family oxidoreductase n=1 Tax=Pseudohoeflea coraliihabitans TaxID=2860393 RepID=A0ABS6WKA4_9HYPH|nr:SDR family oxidoreductase [Pseudohoeflea sp. DP4N28-3]MBW3096368.1 SDR family oxidoreductase [Pseudohoeflea sp. DP4N28-3]
MRAETLFDISGEIALVTGGASGLGRQFAKVLADNGARVFIADKDGAALAATVDALSECEGRVSGSEADVTDERQLAALFSEIEEDAGPVTVLVNNAGMVHRDKAVRLSREKLDTVLAVNVDGAFLVAQAMAKRLMAAKRGGSIINISSILAKQPMRSVIAYGAAKAALSMMTRTMALEWAGSQIRVNEIRPGWFETRLTEDFLKGPGREVLRAQVPLRRLGQPGDLDGALLFLASRASAYMTGASITIDGGYTLGR